MKGNVIIKGAPSAKFIVNGNTGAKYNVNGMGGVPGADGAPGTDGAPGADGAPGQAATVQVGTVTTGEPGTDAIVTNSGTSSDAILNFTIPRGDPGSSASGEGDMKTSDYDQTGAVKDAGGIKEYVAGAIATESPVKSVNGKTGDVIIDAGGEWGKITGNLSEQTDLQDALDGKQATISDLDAIRSGASAGKTAVQPGDLATVATTGGYSDLINRPPTPVLLNVKDYGATGDGATDDTSAIQTALNTASSLGAGVILPEGTYIVDPSVSISLSEGSYLTGVGAGSVIKIKDNSNVLNNLIKAESVNRVTLKDFVIDGNRANQDASDAVACHYGIYLASSDNSRIDGVTVFNTTGVGIHVYDSDNTVITNCESYGNRYHAFECEQDQRTVWSNNNGHDNDRHGIFISPGEVGGAGSIGNVITGNTFSNNGQYGIAFGIDAAGGAIGLTRENEISNNTVCNNAHYGISIYMVDDVLVSNNLVSNNGYFGIYLYKAQRCQIVNNRLRNNSATSNGAYDEILLEGNNDGKASYLNVLAYNYIIIDGSNKANYAIREATQGDGPNMVINNIVPFVGAANDRLLIQNPNTKLSIFSESPHSNIESLRNFANGLIISPNAALPSSVMGLDAPFGNAALRVFSDLGNVQLVATNGNVDFYVGGNNTLSVYAGAVSTHGAKITDLAVGTSNTDAVNMSQLNSISNSIGSLPSLTTTDQSSIVNAINELKTRLDNAGL